MAPARHARVVLVTLLVAACVLAGCTSGSRSSPSSRASVENPPAPATTTSSAPGASGSPSTATAPATVGSCLTLAADAAIVACVEPQLTAFWTARIGRTVTARVVLDATATQVPRSCGTDEPTSVFECPDNRTIYFSRSGLMVIDRLYVGVTKAYVLAYTLGHETGHVVQDTVHQPTKADVANLSFDATSQYIEQQADCLSGVALRHLTWLRNPPLDGDVLARLRSLSDRAETDTHGTPAVRLAAFDRGLHSGDPLRCHIRDVR